MSEKQSCFGVFSVVITFITGVVSFAANIATVSSSLGVPPIEFKGVVLSNGLTWRNIEILPDSSFALATAIYACIVFIFVGYRISQTLGFRILVVVPPLLLSLWSIAYLQDEPWLCFTAILLSQCWVTGLLSLVSPGAVYTTRIYVVCLHPLFVFATTVGVLKYLQMGSGKISWVIAGLLSFATFIFLAIVIVKRRISYQKILDRRSGDITNEVFHILREYKEQANLFLMPNIPPEKLANARRCSAVPASEEVIGLIDCTYFGSAKKAIIFTGKSIYYCTSSRHGYFKYVSFADCEFTISADGILINGTSLLHNSSSFSNLALSEILESIKRAVLNL